MMMNSGGRRYSEWFAALSNRHSKEVARWALDHRRDVSEDARNHLNEAISMDVRLNGFRGAKAPDAPVEILVNPVSAAARANGRVANAVFGVWWESKVELKRLITDALLKDMGEREFKLEGGEPTQEEFEEHLNAAADAVLAENPSLEEHEVRLMAYLTGDQADVSYRDWLHDTTAAENAMMEEALGEGELVTSADGERVFASVMEGMASLPADAPDWDAPFFRLAHRLEELRTGKLDERAVVAFLEERLAAMVERHAETLPFFEWDPAEKLSNRSGPWSDAVALSEAVDRLEAALHEFTRIREMGATYSEERERADRRVTLQDEILTTLEAIEVSAAPPSPEESGENGVAVPDASAELAQLHEQADSLQEQRDRAEQERDDARTRIGELEAERDDAAQTRDDLRKENDELRQQKAELQRNLENMRLTYIDSQRAGESGETVPDFQDVAAALDYVEGRWPDKLRIALNSSSDRKLVFDQPNQLYTALEWLATVYRDARMGERTDLKESLAAACNWDYVPQQSEVTMGKYPSYYETVDDGVTFRLEPHIGRGINRGTGQIRVAFAWDDEREVVVVGYVGRHQHTDAS